VLQQFLHIIFWNTLVSKPDVSAFLNISKIGTGYVFALLGMQEVFAHASTKASLGKSLSQVIFFIV
jgi:hypothetical protein